MAVDSKAFGIAVAVDSAIALVVFAVFAILRRLKFATRYYAPKRYLKTEYKRPKRLPGGLFAWIRLIFQYDERDILETAGMDAVMYFRIISFGLRLFAFLAFWNLVTVLPTNLKGNEVDKLLPAENNSTQGNSTTTDEDDDFEVTNFDKLAITNLSQGDNKFWVHVASAYVTTIFALWLLWHYHKHAVQLRIHYLATTNRGGESHSVLVTDIPGVSYGTILGRALQIAPKFCRGRIQALIDKTKDVATLSVQSIGGVAGNVGKAAGLSLSSERKSSEAEDLTDVRPWRRARQKLMDMSFQEMVESEYREVYPAHEIERVRVVHDEAILEGVVKTYNTTKRELEDLADDYTSKLKRRKRIKPAEVRIIPDLIGSWAKEKYPTDLTHKFIKVDKLDFLINKLEALKQEVEEKQRAASQEYVGSAFITFKSRWSQVVSSTSLHHHDETVWRVQPAPGPEEVFWSNLKWRSWERTVRTILIWSAFAIMCFTFMIPIAAVQALIEIDQLEKVAIIKDIVDITIVRSILTAILPGLVLKIFLALLPALLQFMNKLQGMVSESQIDFGVSKKYFIFQVLTVFFGSFIAGSLLAQVERLREDPDEIIKILGTSAPQTASFFCTFILVEAFLDTPIGLLRLPGFVIYYILTFLAATERAKARLWQEQTMTYGDVVPNHTLVILLGVVFAAINPIITLTALVYFVTNIIVWRYQLLYVYKEEYQSGGKLWMQVFDQILAGLIIMQIMMIGLLGVKKFPFAPVVIPLPFITILFKLASEKSFNRPLAVLSLRGAADLDRSDKMATERCPPSLEEMREADRLYLSPSFKVETSEYEELLAQARTVSAKLKGEDVTLLEIPPNEECYYSAEEEEVDIFGEASDAKRV